MPLIRRYKVVLVYSRINSKAIFFLGLTHQTAPTHFQHPNEKRPKMSKKMLSEHCSMQSSTGREWMPQGAGNGDPWRR